MRRKVDRFKRAIAARALPIPPLFLAGLLLLGGARPTQAQLVNDYWNGSVSTDYGTAGNWSNGVPNNGSPSGTTYNAFITNTSGFLGAVTNGFSPTINSLTTGATNSLTVSNGDALTIVGGPINNAGLLSLASTNTYADLRISGVVSLTGGGTLSLSNSPYNRIYGLNGSNDSLTNVNNTIQGSGTIGITGLVLVNRSAGTIDANLPNALNINAATTNAGLMEATAGGTLNLATTVANTGGAILASGAGSVVSLYGSTVTGGTLTTTSGGTILGGNGTLSGVTITAGSTLTAQDNYVTTLQGTVNNNGTIALSSINSYTDLNVTGTLNNNGSINLSNTPYNRIYGAGTLVNAAADTIQGAGQIGAGNSLTLVNNGTINSNLSAGLIINPAVAVTNTGTIEATAGSTLNLNATVNNSGAGTIIASGAGSVVNLNGATINGGTLTTASGGTMLGGGGVLSGMTVTSGSTLTAQDNTITTLQSTVTNNGTIALSSAGSYTDLNVTGTLNNNGSITLSNYPYNRIYGNGGTLVNGAAETIQGAGQIGTGNSLIVTNNGTINSNLSAGLTINPSVAVTNTSIIEATAGSTLSLPTTINNSGAGTILASGAGSVVSLLNGTINGGTLTTTGGGTMYSGGGILNGVTITTGSTLTAQDNTVTALQGTLTNNGTLAVSSAGSYTELSISGTVTNTGGGSITLSNYIYNRIYGNGGTLINDTSNTIQGSGQIGAGNSLALVNKGTIDANLSAGLTINTATVAVSNTGTLEATSGGSLALPATINNAGGAILASGAGSVVSLLNGTINGGTLTTTGGGAMYAGGGVLNGVTVSTGSTITVQDNYVTNLQGTVTNNGTIAVVSAGSYTDLNVTGTLNNNGSINLSNTPYNRIYGAGTLVNAAADTIQGSGTIGIGQALALVNSGTIDANLSAGLTINPGVAVTNTGTIEATAGSTLALPSTITNVGGTILSSGSGSVVNLKGATINGGTLTTASGGMMLGAGSLLNGVTISSGSTVTLTDNTNTYLQGTIANNGTIALNSAGSYTDINLIGNVTLNGTGTLATTDSPYNRIYGQTGTEVLTNGAGHTIEGAGQIYNLSLTNNGTVLANGANSLTIAPGSGNVVTNNGVFQANGGSELIVNGTLTNFNTTNGTLTGGTYNVYGGATQGIFQFNNGNFTNDIVTNAAKILLDGAGSQIQDQTGVNALANLTANTSAGSLTIQDGRSLTTGASADFTNAGSLTIGQTSNSVADTLTVGGSHNYVQSGGTTLLANSAAILSATAITINGGTVEGFGTLTGAVNNAGGTVMPGDAPGTLHVSGSYTQGSGGTLAIGIAGPTAGVGLGVLAVSGAATLGGTLDISLMNGFTPYNGEEFIILTSTNLIGTFGTINGLTEGNITFSIDYGTLNRNDVTLVATGSVVPEPASLVMFGIGLAAAGLVSARRTRARRR